VAHLGTRSEPPGADASDARLCFGTFVSGIDTFYLFISHQESVYQRYAGAKLDANDLGLIMA